MRLVIFSTDRNIVEGDAPLQVAYAKHFSSFTVFVFSRRGPGGRNPLGENAVAHLVYPGNVLSSLPKIVRAVFKSDIVTSQDPFELGVLAFVFAFVLRKKLHIQVHTDIYTPGFRKIHKGNRLRQIIAPFVVRRAHGVRVVSEKIRESLLKKRVKAPIAVLPIYVDVDSFRVERKKHPHWKLALLSVGRLEREKCFEESIRALALLRAKGHDAGLTIVGSGREKAALEKAALESGTERFVVFAGAQTNIRPFLETADVLLVPSAYEGYGLVIIEALAAGVPVIAKNVGVAEEAGAIIAPHETFPETVLSWAEHGPRNGELHNYPYTSREEYVSTWAEQMKRL